MTALRRLDAPTGPRPGDLVCWTLADTSDFSAVVLPPLDEGRRLGDHLLLIGASRPALVQALVSLPRRDEKLASGLLEVRAPAGSNDPGRALDHVERRAGVRLAADVTQADCILRALLDIAGARMLATAGHLLAEVRVQLRMVRVRRLVGRCLELFDVAEAPVVSA